MGAGCVRRAVISPCECCDRSACQPATAMLSPTSQANSASTGISVPTACLIKAFSDSKWRTSPLLRMTAAWPDQEKVAAVVPSGVYRVNVPASVLPVNSKAAANDRA